MWRRKTGSKFDSQNYANFDAVRAAFIDSAEGSLPLVCVYEKDDLQFAHSLFQHMVQTNMSTAPYATAQFQQNGEAPGPPSAIKAETAAPIKEATPTGGVGGQPPSGTIPGPNFSPPLMNANGAVEQQQTMVSIELKYFPSLSVPCQYHKIATPESCDFIAYCHGVHFIELPAAFETLPTINKSSSRYLLFFKAFLSCFC